MGEYGTTNTFAEVLYTSTETDYGCKQCIICGESIPIRSSYGFHPEVCLECKKAMMTLKRMLNIAKHSTDELV